MTVTIIGAGQFYTSVDAWEATLTGVLTEDQEGALLNQLFLPTNGWTITGFTTSPTAKFILRNATAAETGGASARHSGAAGSGARIQKTGAGGFGVIYITDVNIKHFELRGLELFAANGNNYGLRKTTAFDYALIRNCLLYDFAQTALDVSLASGVSTCRVVNCAFANTLAPVLGVTAAPERVEVYHSTAIKSATYTTSVYSGFRNVLAQNCYAGHFGQSSGARDFTSLGAGSSNNASFDASGNLTGLAPADLFVNVGAPWDWRLKEGTALEGAGVPIPSIIAFDFEDDPRDPVAPDIGFDERVVAGPAEILGAATVILAPATVAAAAALDIAGTASVTLQRATVAADATLVSGLTGAAAVTLARATAAATGALDIVGAASPTLARATVAAAGTLPIVGAAAATLARATVAAEGTLVSGLTGAATVTLQRATLASAGALTLSGTAAAMLQRTTVAAAGTLAIVGNASPTLQRATLAAEGTLVSGLTGAVTISLQRATVAAAGTLPIVGAASPTLARATVAAAGALSIFGTASPMLARATVTAAGTLISVGPGVNGSLIVTLARATLAAAGFGVFRPPEIREELRAYLVGQPMIAHLVGPRLTWGPRNRSAGLPAVTLYMIDGERDYAMSRPTGLVRARVQIDCWGQSYADAVYTARAIRRVLSGLRAKLGGVEIQGAFADLERDLSEDDAGEGAEELLFRVSTDYQIWHTE